MSITVSTSSKQRYYDKKKPERQVFDIHQLMSITVSTSSKQRYYDKKKPERQVSHFLFLSLHYEHKRKS